MDSIERLDPSGSSVQQTSALAIDEPAGDSRRRQVDPVVALFRRSPFLRWLVQDSPYTTMLLLTLVGVVFRLPVRYWVVLTPGFGVISVAAGWRRFAARGARLDLVCRVTLSWCALLIAIYLLYDGGVQRAPNANANLDANTLAMMTLLALGTFVAGVQAKVWRSLR
jgi:hypothetical protein